MRKPRAMSSESESGENPVQPAVHNAPWPDSAPASRRAPADPARKARPGARKGNAHALKHGAFSARMQAARKRTGNLRDSHRRRGENEARSILSGLGLAKSPLARLV